MKRRCLLLLLILALLLPGCTGQQKPPAEKVALTGPEPRDIYFSLGNDFHTLYPYYSVVPGPDFYIYSRTPIDPDTISVTLPIDASYSVNIFPQKIKPGLFAYEISEEDGVTQLENKGGDGEGLPLYIYQTYAGIDWGAVKEAYIRTLPSSSGDEGESQDKEAARAAFRNAELAYAAGYLELTREDLPEFYVYKIQVAIDDRPSKVESFTNLQISVGEQVYEVPVGEVQICPSDDLYTGGAYLQPNGGSPLWMDSYPYGPGINRCFTGEYYAAEPLTLTGVDYLEDSISQAEPLEVIVHIAEVEREAASGGGMSIPWDGKTPIPVKKGQYVCLEYIIRDPRMREPNYNSRLYPLIQFTCEDGAYQVVGELLLRHTETSNWLLYAMGLDGLDMESYFADYYYVVVSPWQQAYLDKLEKS